MKKSFILLFFQLIYLAAPAQTREWAWISGDNFSNQPGNYGTKGVAAATNKPGARHLFTGSKDAAGNLWLFGGGGYANGSSQGYLNDLWKYNPSSNEWTWAGGDNAVDQPGIYGTKGEAAPENKPGGRVRAVSWTDNNGNLWVFGGNSPLPVGSAIWNDLWKFDPSTGQWTWVSGDNVPNQQGVYGIRGSAAPANKPGSRYNATTWTDNEGNLWLFGGYGYATTPGPYLLNDLWKFTPSTGHWTWVSGNNTTNALAVYGTKGEAASANKPGARYSGFGAADSGGNLWLFAGEGNDASSRGRLNDLWKYSIAANQWTWVSGDNTINAFGVYGTKGVPASGNKPGGREYAAGAMDNNGNLWVYAGHGYLATGNPNLLNDLWKFDLSARQWTWVSGDSIGYQNPVFGSRGVSSPSYKPGARQSAVGWSDESGNFWLIGGNGLGRFSSGLLNDVWRYGPHTRRLEITAPIAASLCAGAPVTITFEDTGSFQPGNTFTAQLSNASGSFASPVSIGSVSSMANGAQTINAVIPANTVAGTGYHIRIVSSNPAVIGTDNGTNITISSVPMAQITGATTVCQGSTLALSATSVTGATYSWTGPDNFSANTRVIGIDNIAAAQAGTYTVTINNNGCSATASAPVTVNPAPVAIAGSDRSICAGTSTSLGTTAQAGRTYSWTSSPAGFTSTAANPTVSPSVTTIYTLRETITATGCQRSNSVTVTVIGQPVLNIQASAPILCSGATLTFTASPTGVGSSPAYQWQKNGVNISGATASVFTTSSLKHGDVIRYVLTNVTGCSASGTLTSSGITVAARTPPAPASITGPSAVCRGAEHTYAATPVPNVDSYTWMAPAGATILSGQGTPAVRVSFGPSYTTGYVKVAATNCRGTGKSRALAVTRVRTPSTPDPISGDARVCTGEPVAYSIAAVANATSYTWSVPEGATLVSGQGTASAVVMFSNSFISGTMSASASNCTGTSPARTLSLARRAVPVAPKEILGTTAPVCQEPNEYTVAPVAGVTSYTWTVPAGAVLLSGQGTNTIQLAVAPDFEGGLLGVSASNCTGASSARYLRLNDTSGDTCQPAPVVRGQAEEPMSQRLSVRAAPNPAVSQFTLRFSGGSGKFLQVKVVDAAGRVVEARTGVPSNTTLQLGDHYRPGMYLVEVVQGSERRVLKVIKE